MDTIFKISDLISNDIRSRANADIIRSAIDGIKENIVLDFSGVVFVSRSFTDELYNVMEENSNISLVNTSAFVKTMIETVTNGRKSKRIFKQSKSEIKEMEDMNSLASFLSTI